MTLIFHTESIAQEFARIIRQWLTPEELALCNTINKRYDFEKSDCCATHEFCDPNQAMIDAFTNITEIPPDIQNDTHMQIMNKAWNIAKKREFQFND